MQSTGPSANPADSSQKSVTLEEIDTVDDFIGNLERIELPSQLVAVLADPLLQKYLTLRSSEEANARISYWLQSFLQTKQQSAEENAHDTEFLEAVLGFLRNCKVRAHSKRSVIKLTGVAAVSTRSRQLHRVGDLVMERTSIPEDIPRPSE
jgi:hypothetical protein